MRKIALLLLPIVLMAGCITAPKDVGFGPYQQFFTTSGVLMREGQLSSPSQCELVVRQNWSTYVANGTTSKCSSISRAKELPYVTKLSSNFSGETLPIAFDSLAQCKSLTNEIRSSDLIKKVPDLQIDPCTKRLD
jgi:hypothetical protein